MKRPPRFVIKRADIHGAVAQLRGAELHHLRDVLRMQPGARLSLIDEHDVEYRGRVEHLAADYATITILAIGAEPSRPCDVTLAVAIIKGARMDFLVEKAAELGVTQLIPLRTAHGLVLDPGRERLERWQRLALAAAKQSLSAFRMTISPPTTVAQLAALIPPEAITILCDPAGNPIADLPETVGSGPVVLACGPEGGFNAEEIAILDEAGFISASLGPNRLRAETAAIAAAAIAVAKLWQATERG
jgi:16S rRNA (uracil1498-N3)-methyltransferase